MCGTDTAVEMPQLTAALPLRASEAESEAGKSQFHIVSSEKETDFKNVE